MSEPTGTQYGGFWVRVLALLADSAIVFLASTALLAGAAMMLGPEELAPAVFAVSLLGLSYWPLMHASRAQATFGKAIIGLKVARLDGERISILRSLWRELAKIFSAAVLMLGYLMAAVLPRKQGLHDLMAGTYVVREGPSRIIAALAIAAAGFALPVFVGPMVAPALISKITSTAERMVPRQDLVKRVLEHDLLKLVSREDSAKKQAARSAAPASKAARKPQAKPTAPKPHAPSEAVAVAPKAAPPKPRPVPPRPPSTSKTGSGTMYNDLVTAVMYQDVEGVNQLLRLGKWVDKPDSRGVTPLMIAAERGDLRTAEALLRGGANARLAVRVAEQRGDREMVQLLKRYAGG